MSPTLANSRQVLARDHVHATVEVSNASLELDAYSPIIVSVRAHAEWSYSAPGEYIQQDLHRRIWKINRFSGYESLNLIERRLGREGYVDVGQYDTFHIAEFRRALSNLVRIRVFLAERVDRMRDYAQCSAKFRDCGAKFTDVVDVDLGGMYTRELRGAREPGNDAGPNLGCIIDDA